MGEHRKSGDFGSIMKSFRDRSKVEGTGFATANSCILRYLMVSEDCGTFRVAWLSSVCIGAPEPFRFLSTLPDVVSVWERVRDSFRC